MDFEWIGKHGVHDHTVYVNECTCDLHVTLKNPELKMANKFFVSRYDNHESLTSQEMIEKLSVKLAVTWKLHQGVFSLQKGDERIREAIVRSLGVVGRNQIPIPAPVSYPFIPRQEPYEYSFSALGLYQMWDRYYFNKYYGWPVEREFWRQNVWKKIYSYGGVEVAEGLEWSAGFGDLKLQALREASFYNQTFTGTVVKGDKFWYSCYAQEGLYPEKIPKLLQKFDKETTKPTPMMAAHMYVWPKAIDMMNKYAGWDKLFGRYEWSYSRNSKYINPPLVTAFGNRPGPQELLHEAPCIRIYRGCTGKKLEQMEWMLLEMEKFVEAVCTDDFSYCPPAAYYKIVIKSEVHIVSGLGEDFIASLKKIKEKAREYFIPDLFTIALSMLVHGERQKLERGKLIRIGINWNHGGMYFFACDNRYDDPDMIFLTFDVTGLDTCINVIQLMMDNYATQQYYTFNDKVQEKLFKKMLAECGERMAYKITQMFGSIWRIIIGVMPSGAFRTSNGNSWIVSVTYFSMFVWLMLQDAEFRKVFVRLYQEGKVLVNVYGDDNVGCWHKDLLPWLNEKTVPKFFLDWAGFLCRDVRIFTQFLSVLDGTGGLKQVGVNFLQKYAIQTPYPFQQMDVPPVVHFRPLRTNVIKYGKGSSGDKRTDLDYLLSSVTGPYDNPCNEQWYEFCRMAFQYYIKILPHWRTRINEVLSKSNGYVTRQVRKNRIPVEELRKGFPRKQQLIELLKKNQMKYEASYADDIWGEDLYA